MRFLYVSYKKNVQSTKIDKKNVIEDLETPSNLFIKYYKHLTNIFF